MRDLRPPLAWAAFAGLLAVVALHAQRHGADPRGGDWMESRLPQDPNTEEPASDARPKWKPLWSLRIALPEALSVSPDGRRVVARDRRNRFTAIDGIKGKVLWTTPEIPRVREMQVLDGGTVLCWAPLDPEADGLTLLNATNGAVSTLRIKGSLWSVAPSPDGKSAWVGCGDRTLRRVDLSGTSGPVVKLPGIPDALAVSARGVFAGMWLDSGLAGVSLEGKLLWTVARSDPARRWKPFATADGRRAWVISTSGPRRKDPRLERFDPAAGTTLWEKPLDGEAIRWVVSQQTGKVALSERTPSDGLAKLHVLDPDGVWRVRGKGSRFLEPTVMAMSGAGDRITILDGARGMLTLDDRGRTTSRRMALPKDPAAQSSPRPSRWTQTPDGSRLLVLGENGVATLYAALP